MCDWAWENCKIHFIDGCITATLLHTIDSICSEVAIYYLYAHTDRVAIDDQGLLFQMAGFWALITPSHVRLLIGLPFI